jgi:hypothetical protein
MDFTELNYWNNTVVGRNSDHVLRQHESDKYSNVNFWAVMNCSRMMKIIAMCKFMLYVKIIVSYMEQLATLQPEGS